MLCYLYMCIHMRVESAVAVGACSVKHGPCHVSAGCVFGPAEGGGSRQGRNSTHWGLSTSYCPHNADYFCACRQGTLIWQWPASRRCWSSTAATQSRMAAATAATPSLHRCACLGRSGIRGPHASVMRAHKAGQLGTGEGRHCLLSMLLWRPCLDSFYMHD